jgi:putative zinc finger protein
MKCDDCLNLLETYLDGEAGERETDLMRAHLTSCANCEARFEALTAENESYARYDREIQISPAVWNGVAARIAAEDRQIEREAKSSFADWISGLLAIPALRFAMPTVALIAIAVVIGLAYWRMRPQQPRTGLTANNNISTPSRLETPPVKGTEDRQNAGAGGQQDQRVLEGAPVITAKYIDRRMKPGPATPSADQSDVLPDTSAASTDIEDRDTANHLAQAENLLLSLRNIKYSETDEEVDVSYEKAESRRLLSENVVLRRDAEMAGKFPAKSMLGSLEPFLIDIANLPDKAKPSEVSQITDRVQRTEIVAELRGY